jgi:hypothetical protein
MRIVSLVVAGVLALAWFTPVSQAGSSAFGAGESKAPAAKRGVTPKPKAGAKPAGTKADVSSLGSAARQELLKSRLQGGAKAKSPALQGKPKAKS